MNAPSGTRRMVGPAPIWAAYLSLGTFLMLLYAFVPPFKGSGPVINLLGLSSSVAIVAGVRMYRPRCAVAWWLFAIGQFLFFSGDLYTYSYPKLLGADVPFPSAGDVAYLLVYPVLLAGLVQLIRSRTPFGDRGGLIDSIILTVGFALLSWVFLIVPYGDVSGLSKVALGVSVAYPLGDVLLLAGAIRLAVDAGRKPPAFFLLIGSIVCLLTTDSAYTYTLLKDTYNGQMILDMGWISYYLLWGAAALHPSMRELSEPVARSTTQLTRRRLVLLATACLIAPAIRIIGNLHHLDVAVIQIASAVLFLLVLGRMVGMVRQEERSTVLRSAGVELVGAASREQIHQAATAAVSALARVNAETRLVLAEEQDAVVIGAGPEPAACDDDELRWLIDHDGKPVAHGAIPGGVRSTLNVPERTQLLVATLRVRGVSVGALVVCTREAFDSEAVEAIDALAAQVALAVEGAVAAEDAHRRQSEARFGSLVAHATDLITVVNERGAVAYQSPSIDAVLGRGADDVEGTSFLTLVRESDRPRMAQLLDPIGDWGDDRRMIECALEHADGSFRQFEVQATNLLHDPDVHGIVLNSRDISERKAFEQELSHQAFHDPVTGLANRALFADRVTHALNRRSTGDQTIGLMFIDLDDFKTINDSLGHTAGDRLLNEVARRLSEVVRPNDTVARFGGDEFAILLEELPGVQQAADMAERVLARLEQPVLVDSKETYARASIGICMATPDQTGEDADELLRNADLAMYMAKRNNKGGYRLFEPEMHETLLERLELRDDLQHAIAQKQLEVHYQPVMRLKDDAVYGVEALLRWTHPTRGQISPMVFIPLAEETGLIIPIGGWVLREACAEALRIDEHFTGTEPITMSVNLSVRQLQDEDIVDDVRAALESTGLDPSRLVLEITESVMIADAELALERLMALKALGVRLAMDDFGTGYSSLSYLSKFPVDILKMDRSFLTTDRVESGLAAAIVGLGETLQVDVVAEGIELATQTESLRELGCKLGQGFLYAKPMHPSALPSYLASVSEAGGQRDAA